MSSAVAAAATGAPGNAGAGVACRPHRAARAAAAPEICYLCAGWLAQPLAQRRHDQSTEVA